MVTIYLEDKKVKEGFLKSLGYGEDMHVEFVCDSVYKSYPSIVAYRIYIKGIFGNKHYRTVECDNYKLMEIFNLKGFRFDTIDSGNFSMDMVLTND